jgi:hypothetical protein
MGTSKPIVIYADVANLLKAHSLYDVKETSLYSILLEEPINSLVSAAYTK